MIPGHVIREWVQIHSGNLAHHALGFEASGGGDGRVEKACVVVAFSAVAEGGLVGRIDEEG